MSPAQTVEWGSGPIRFELRSPEKDVIDKANAVFSRWRPDPNARLVGTWNVERKGDEIIVDPRNLLEDGSQPPTLTDPMHAVAVVEYAAIARIVERCDEVLSFHAALLAKNGKSIAIVGPSHAGKSTLATALWKNGWKLQTDDLTMTIGRTALAGPRRVALRTESREHLGDDLWDLVPSTAGYFRTNVGCLFQPMHIDESYPERLELDTTFFLKRNGAPANGSPQRLSSVDAAFALLPYTNLVRTQPFTQAFRAVAELMTSVAGYDLPRAPIAQMVASVEEIATRPHGVVDD
jgi:hypothetical protein